jgi:hypothetical protein
MLITSKFRDFYDNCAAYGVDTQVRYNREEEKVRMTPYSPGKRMDNPSPVHQMVINACDGWGRRLTGDFADTIARRDPYDVVVFGFCGVLHRVVLFRETKPTNLSVMLHSSIFDKKSYVAAFDKTALPADWYGQYRNWRTERTLFEDFETPVFRENVEVFTALNVPMFIAFDNTLITNPCLKEWGLTKFKDGVSVFQEISAFISGTLNTANQMKHTASDQELIQAHGFDKHSFRKGKQK